MKTTDRMAAAIGLDVHRRFSTVTARNAEGKIAWRERLEHEDRDDLRKHLATWPRGMPVILESSFGWEWRRGAPWSPPPANRTGHRGRAPPKSNRRPARGGVWGLAIS